jgi:Ca2+-binding RTX toxin-like protein
LAISVIVGITLPSFLFVTLNVHAVNIVIGSTNTTTGTDEDDVIIGCSHLTPQCSQGSYLFGLEGDDSLQGSSADDSIFGDEGNDDLTGGDGNDKLFGGNGKDVLQGGFGGDFLFGASGNDELYSGAGDDILTGGKGSDYFDCGEGYDTVIDFDPARGDTKGDNCEVALTHNPNDIQFTCDGGSNSYGSSTSVINSIFTNNNNNNNAGKNILSTSSDPSALLCDELGEVS